MDDGEEVSVKVEQLGCTFTPDTRSAPIHKPTISPAFTSPTAPVTVTAKQGERATLTVAADYTLIYMWQVYTGDGWKNIPGAEGEDYRSYVTPPLTKADNGARYRCRAINNVGEAFSPEFTLRIASAVVPPKTGDSAAPGLWLALLALAGAGVVAAVSFRRRRAER